MSQDKPVSPNRHIVASRRAYMDLTDFEWELGQTTTKTYASAAAVKRAQPACTDECGIAEVTITLRRIVRRPKLPSGGRKRSLPGAKVKP